MNEYTLSFRSDAEEVKPVVTETISRVRNHFPFISIEDEGDLRLVLSELLYNAAIHGNGQDISKTVRLRVGINEASVVCVVADEGSGFDYKKFLDGFKNSDNSRENAILESDHGRGILLAVSLSDRLTFNSKGNEIAFCKYLGGVSHG